MSAVPIAGRPHVVIDIGGGSTEVIAGNGTAPALARSLKLGHIRLTDRFFPSGVIADGAVKACRRHIRSFLAPVAREAQDIGFEVAVGCSGTIASLAHVCAASRGEALRTAANATIERSDLTAVVAELIARPRPADRLGVPGLEPRPQRRDRRGRRAAQAAVQGVGIQSMVVSTGALREGCC